MRIEKYRHILVWNVAALLLITAAAVFYATASERKLNADLNALSQCFRQKKNQAICTVPTVKRMLTATSTLALMNVLEEHFGPGECHILGHVVGQQTYIQEKDVEAALSRCSATCDSACGHGAVGEAFADELGYDDPEVDLKHLSPNEMREVGQKLCASPQACHGVGHALFQGYKEFPPALDMCGTLSKVEVSVNYCYTGVFMEYADILKSRNFRPTESIAYPTPKELLTFCTRFEDREVMRSCFSYFPRIATVTLALSGASDASAYTRMKAVCGTYPPGYIRSACFAGIGFYGGGLTITNPPAARSTCEKMPHPPDIAACNQGLVRVDSLNRMSTSFPYCASLPDEKYRESCFHGLAYRLDALGVTAPDMEARCSGDAACLRAVEARKLDPWRKLEADFGK